MPRRWVSTNVGIAAASRTTAPSPNAAVGDGSSNAPPIPTATAPPAAVAISCALVAAGRRSSPMSSATSVRCAVVSAFMPVYASAAASASARYELACPSPIATRPPAASSAPPAMNGSRRPRPPAARRSDHSPTPSGTAKPAIALTVMTAPISDGESSIRSSRTGR
jgi:hypothetical protein